MSPHAVFALLARLAANGEVVKALDAATRVEMDDLLAEYEAQEAAHDAHLEAMADAEDIRAEMAAMGCREWDNVVSHV